MFEDLEKELLLLKDSERAKHSARFFKTGKGEYGEGDVFLGISVPKQREIARKYRALPLHGIQKLLKSEYHEFRLTGLFILVLQYQKASLDQQKEIVEFYLKHKKYINNWDLIDTTAPHILGSYLLGKDTSLLYRLARSDSIWDKRLAMLTTQAFIRKNDFKDALKIAEILLFDKHDLIQKAVGWMLREIGDRDSVVERAFLDKHYKKMPRTALRYAIEKFTPELRKYYLS